jgi:hypothetical protein
VIEINPVERHALIYRETYKRGRCGPEWLTRGCTCGVVPPPDVLGEYAIERWFAEHKRAERSARA